MPNYWGGEFGSPEAGSEDSIYAAKGSETGFSPESSPSPNTEIKDELEARRERLQGARESILAGSSLHIIDDVDLFSCEYVPAGGGPLEVVYKGAVVGYAKDDPQKYSQEIKFN
ncbi:MAG: hypothetical protein PHT36_03030 [Patescibacteria group bacterium]|nr:hypothetical protein [Patescibacteria group bacterium]